MKSITSVIALLRFTLSSHQLLSAASLFIHKRKPENRTRVCELCVSVCEQCRQSALWCEEREADVVKAGSSCWKSAYVHVARYLSRGNNLFYCTTLPPAHSNTLDTLCASAPSNKLWVIKTHIYSIPHCILTTEHYTIQKQGTKLFWMKMSQLEWFL